MDGLRLGIEIGGTKLQLGVGAGDGKLIALERRDINPRLGAAGIRQSISDVGQVLLRRFELRGIGVGFGGPVTNGRTIKSHQIDGWDDFPLKQWLEDQFQLPAVVGNDCDVAALAEATCGAGRDLPPEATVFFVTVGTGVGGGLVIARQLHGAGRPAVAEVGHLRPGLQANRPEQTVESVASGWGIVAEAVARIRGDLKWPVHDLGADEPDAQRRRQEIVASNQLTAEYAADLVTRCGGDLESLTAADIATAAGDGNQLAADSLSHAIRTLGWAIAQVVTLTAADLVVVGGGVSLIGEAGFFRPLREAAQQYVFPPLADAYQIVPAALGEDVVVHGAIGIG